MIDRAGFSLSATAGKPGWCGRGAKNTLAAVSAAGMVAVLAVLAQGRWLLAGTIFLLTIGILDVMIERALVTFHGAATARQAIGDPAARGTATGK
jgi:hypothetical protein